jgi:hypothetical protein
MGLFGNLLICLPTSMGLVAALSTFVNRVHELHERLRGLEAEREAEGQHQEGALKVMNGSYIELNDVSCKIPGNASNQLVLRNVSCRFQRGQNIIITGPRSCILHSPFFFSFFFFILRSAGYAHVCVFMFALLLYVL